MLSGCRGTTVPNVCLQALTLSLLSPHDFFTLSPNREPVHRLDVSRLSRVTTLKKFTKKRDSYAELLF